MKPIELKITRIGNSHGIRIPADTLKRYQIRSAVIMEQRSDGIFLRPTGPSIEKLSWAETAREMEAASEDWSDWAPVDSDGLSDLPWEPARVRRVAEKRPSYPTASKKKRS